MENNLWEYIKLLAQSILVPIAGIFVWSYKKRISKYELMEDNLKKAETDIEVLKARLDSISYSMERVDDNLLKLLELVQRK